MIKARTNVIRVSFRREIFRVILAKPIVALAGSSLLLIETLIVWPDDPAPLRSLLLPLAAMLGLCASLALWLSLKWHLEVGPDGLDAYGVWSDPRHIHWNEVKQARLIHVMGLDLLVIQSSNGQRVWIPLLFERSDLLLKMILNYAGHVNVIGIDDSTRPLAS